MRRPKWCLRAIEHEASDSPRPSNKGYKAGTPDLYPLQKTIGDKFLSRLTIRPRFVGLAARPRAATLPHTAIAMLCVWQSWRLPRCSAGGALAPAVCPRLERGLRSTPWGSWCSTGGTGSAGEAGRRAPPKNWGFPRRGSRTCHDSPRRCSGLSNTSDTRLRCASPTKRGRKAQDTQGDTPDKKTTPDARPRRGASH